METTNPNNSLSTLPFLRGVSALFVVLYHFVLGIPDYFTQWSFISNVSKHGYIGLYLFFFISGVVIPYSMYRANYTWKFFPAFMLKRFFRLEPLYWVNILFVILLAYSIYWATKDVSRIEMINLENVIYNTLHISGLLSLDWLNVVYWTLSIEIQYYLVIAIGYYFLISENVVIRIVYIGLLSSVGLLVTHHDVYFTYASIFGLGNLVFLFLIDKISWKVFLGLLLVLGGQIYFTFGGITICVFLISIILILNRWKGWGWMNWIGEISYSLYLFHLPIGIRFINYGYKNYTEEGVRFLFLILAILVSIVISWLFYRWVEVPSLKWSKKIKY